MPSTSLHRLRDARRRLFSFLQDPQGRPRPLVSNLAFVVGIFVALGTYLALAVFYALSAEIVVDEGYGLLAIRDAFAGRIPCVDFGFLRLPLAPYVVGWPLALTGYGLIGMRVLNLVYGAFAVLAIIAAAWRITAKREAAVLAGFLIAASPYGAWMMAQATMTAFCALSVAAAACAAAFAGTGKIARIGFCVASALAVSCYLPAWPVAVTLLVLFVVRLEGGKNRLIWLSVAVASWLLCCTPFIAAGGDDVLFFNWVYPYESGFSRRGMTQWGEWWRMSPAVILVNLAALFGIAELVKRRAWDVGVLLVAGLVGLVGPMLAASAYGFNVAPFLGLATLASVSALWRAGAAQGHPFRFGLWLLPAIILVYPLPPVAPDGFDPTAELDELERSLNSRGLEGPILTPLGFVAAQLGRDVLSGTELGALGVMPRKAGALAAAHGLTTIEALTEAIEKKRAAAVVLSTSKALWNFRWSVPSFRKHSSKVHNRFTQALERGYHRVTRTDNFELYVPKEDVAGN